MNGIVARRLVISGLVQGVGFRFFAQRAAARHQVTGFVRNLEDGTVEAFIQGPEKKVVALRDDLAAGPRYSRVDHVEEIVAEPTGEFSTFRIER